jgi:hypothetical protein
MNRSFGPWSTAMDTGAHPELSTFWKRRLAMLPLLGQTASRVSRRAVLTLVVLAVVALLLPTLHWVNDRNAEGRDRPPAVEYYPQPTAIEEKLIAALEKPTTIDFAELPLKDGITYLGEFHNIAILLDKVHLKKESVPLDQPLTLKLADTPLRSVLKLLLEPAQLTYVVEDDAMKITTQTRADNSFVTRTYPVGDLYQGRSKTDENSKPVIPGMMSSMLGLGTDDLVSAIKTVAPATWMDAGEGSGTITYVKESGSLVIHQTAGTHAKILELLRGLREAKGKTGGKKK